MLQFRYVVMSFRSSLRPCTRYAKYFTYSLCYNAWKEVLEVSDVFLNTVLAMCLVYVRACVRVCVGGREENTGYVLYSKKPVKYEGERIFVKVPFGGRKMGEELNWDTPWILS